MSTQLSKRVAHSWTVFLAQFRLFVLAFWVIVASLGVCFGPKLNSLTSTKSGTIKGSLSAEADELFSKNFPQQKGSDVELVLIQQHHSAGPDLLASGFLDSITSAVEMYVAGNPHGVSFIVSGYATGNISSAFPSQFISKDNRSSFLTLQSTANMKRVGHAVQDLLSSLQGNYGKHDLFIGGTGGGLLLVEASVASQTDTGKMDKMALPLALFILLCILRSLRQMVLPILCMGVAIVTALLVMYCYASIGGQVSSVAPAVMLSLQLALSIDYSLFLLTRFQEECKQSLPRQEEDAEDPAQSQVRKAVEQMLATSGKTIVGSGATLCLCFIALLFFPVALMRSLGVALLVAIIVAIMVNLSVTPALLLTFPNCFSKPPCTTRSCLQSRWGVLFCRRRRPNALLGAVSLSATGESLDLSEYANSRTQPHDPGRANSRKVALPMYFRLAKFVTLPLSTFLAAAVILAISAPGLMVSLQMQKSTDMMLLAPRDGSVVNTNNRLVKVFQAGITTPYQLLLIPTRSRSDEDGTVLTDMNFWSHSQALLTQIDSQLEGKASVTSLMYSSMFGNLSQLEIRAALVQNCNLMKNQTLAGLCSMVQTLGNNTLNSRRTILYASIVTDYLGGTEKSTKWTRDCRSLLADPKWVQGGVRAYLDGVNAIVLDAVDAVYDTLPYVLVSVLIAGMMMLGIMYKSILIPLRALISIGVTIIFSFCLSIGIYQLGWMNGFPGGKFDACGGLTWMNPAMAFCIILGLSLDYDIFLVGRIIEFRMLGFNDKEAVQLGLWKTGSVITSAGFIMGVAFSGLMLSDVPMLNQFSVFLVSAVVLDTFIVRPLIVPPIMSAFGNLNWLPRKMPALSETHMTAEEYVAGQ